MLANQSDQPTQRMPLPDKEALNMTPSTRWMSLSNDDKARFLLVSLRTLNHRPLPDPGPGWGSLMSLSLAHLDGGSLVLTPVGVMLMQYVIETELGWVAGWL